MQECLFLDLLIGLRKEYLLNEIILNKIKKQIEDTDKLINIYFNKNVLEFDYKKGFSKETKILSLENLNRLNINVLNIKEYNLLINKLMDRDFNKNYYESKNLVINPSQILFNYGTVNLNYVSHTDKIIITSNEKLKLEILQKLLNHRIMLNKFYQDMLNEYKRKKVIIDSSIWNEYAVKLCIEESQDKVILKKLSR